MPVPACFFFFFFLRPSVLTCCLSSTQESKSFEFVHQRCQIKLYHFPFQSTWGLDRILKKVEMKSGLTPLSIIPLRLSISNVLSANCVKTSVTGQQDLPTIN